MQSAASSTDPSGRKPYPPVPADLRAVCATLTFTPPEHLPPLLHTINSQVLRCQEILAATPDGPSKDASADGQRQVRQLKTCITALVNGKTPQAHLCGITLVKAVVDVGGWECLKSSDPWVRGMVAILSKKDPVPIKEMALISTVRIYMLLQQYTTLAREIVHPTLPAFVSACLQLVKPAAPSQVLPAIPLSAVESIFEALSTVVTLYPTLMRSSATQIRTALRPFLAPTSSDGVYVPAAIQTAARRLLLTLHHTAAQGLTSDEWAKTVRHALQEAHRAGDLIFRAVEEAWSPSEGYGHTIQADVNPQTPSGGGGDAPDDLSSWKGVRAGGERMMGYISLLGDALRYPTKAAVAIPVTAYLDLVARLALLSRKPHSAPWDQCLNMRAGILREEKDQLFSVLQDLHLAALQLQLTLLQRLGSSLLSLVPEMLEDTLRILASDLALAPTRAAVYAVMQQVLEICGPSMPKSTVDSLDIVIKACCRDLLEDVGFLDSVRPAAPAESGLGTKKNESAANADLFLAKPSTGSSIVRAGDHRLEADHRSTAQALLKLLYTHLPQQFLRPTHRELLDLTAIVTHDKDAMLASVLNPYAHGNKGIYASILPFLQGQAPHDQGVEVLRSYFRTSKRDFTELLEPSTAIDTEISTEESVAEPKADVMEGITHGEVAKTALADILAEQGKQTPAKKTAPPNLSPWATLQTQAPTPSTQYVGEKRAIEGEEEEPKRASKRAVAAIEGVDVAPIASSMAASTQIQPRGEVVDEDSDDESVHLNMELDDDEDDEEEGDEEDD